MNPSRSCKRIALSQQQMLVAPGRLCWRFTLSGAWCLEWFANQTAIWLQQRVALDTFPIAIKFHA